MIAEPIQTNNVIALTGYLYLLHFSAPLGNPAKPHGLAAHYVGWTLDLERRIASHKAGYGAKITAAAVQRGITFEVYAWPAPRWFEREFKAQKNTKRFCPACCAAHGWSVRSVKALAAQQLELPLDDFPTAPDLALDFYEISYQRRWRSARAELALVTAGDDDLL